MLAVNELYCGDCFEVMDFIDDLSIDAVLTDLPYGMTNNKWDSVINLHALWKVYKRVLKKSGVIILTASQPFTSKLVMSNIEMFKHEWIWIKNKGSNFLNVKREPFKEHESVLVFAFKAWTYNRQMQERAESGKSRRKYTFKNERLNSDNYNDLGFKPGRFTETELRSPSSHQKFVVEAGLHPTQKPVPLFEYLIRTYTNEGNLVLDNCIGSGTTAIAAIRSKRNWIGIEKSEEYCQIAIQRIVNEQSTNQ